MMVKTKEKECKEIEFPVIIEQDEDGMYIIECPQFKGCYTHGTTRQDALENIKEVIKMCVEEKDAAIPEKARFKCEYVKVMLE